MDWIGLYNIVNNEVFTKSYKPIQSISVNAKKSGNFLNYSPPNSPAGNYLFIYFRKFVPFAISDLVSLQQPNVNCPKENDKKTMSNIKHLIVICTENHSFDSYFGSYCEAPENSNPQCNNGPSCCEKPP